MNKEEKIAFSEKQVKEYNEFVATLETDCTVLNKARLDIYSFLSGGVLYEVHTETDNYGKMRNELSGAQNVVAVYYVPSKNGKLELLTDPEEVSIIANDLMYELFETRPYEIDDFLDEGKLAEEDDFDNDAADAEIEKQHEREFLNG
jgi:hypothetical protein